MSVAVLISGNMRTADVCLDSISRHILRRIGSGLGDPAIYIEAAEDADAWKVEVFPGSVLGRVRPQPQMDEKNYQEKIGLGCYGVQVVLRQLWSLRESWRLMESDGLKPDWVIRLRPDCWFHNNIEELSECDPRAVYVPTFHNFFGLNDRFAFGGYDVMKVYHERLDTMDEYIAAGGVFHPESHLKWVLATAGIPFLRTKVTFDLIRGNGQRIKPQWNHDCYYGDIPPT